MPPLARHPPPAPPLQGGGRRRMPLDPDTFESLLGTVRRYVAERLRPLEARVAEDDEVPPEIVREMRDMGLFGLSIPEAYGGLGLGMEEEARVAIELGR